jgi:hypothetical protein
MCSGWIEFTVISMYASEDLKIVNLLLGFQFRFSYSKYLKKLNVGMFKGEPL